MKKDIYKYKTAFSLLFVQLCFLEGVKHTEGKQKKLELVQLSSYPLKAKCFIAPAARDVAVRISTARVERVIRNINGRRLPA